MRIWGSGDKNGKKRVDQIKAEGVVPGVMRVHMRRVGSHTDVGLCEALVRPHRIGREAGHLVGQKLLGHVRGDVSVGHHFFNLLDRKALIPLEIGLGHREAAASVSALGLENSLNPCIPKFSTRTLPHPGVKISKQSLD
jgi:hypothetical protein